MAVKKRDFQKLAILIQEFLGKLACDESTAELRDSLNLALLNLQKYYKTLRGRCRSLSNGLCPPNSTAKSLGGSLFLFKNNGVVSPVSPACGSRDIFQWKWYNLDSPRLCASLGTDEFSSLSPVLQLSKDGNKNLLKELIEKDQGVVNQVDSLGRNALMYTVHGNTASHTECLELLLTTDCDIDHQANDDSTSLHLAAHDNNSTALLLLLKKKASVNLSDNEGRTSLHWAAANPSTENLKMLLQFGANMSATDNEGLTPSMWACHFDQLGNFQILKSALARIDPRDDALFEDRDCCSKSIIHWAVNRTGSTECLKELISEETVQLCTNEGKNVIHIAAEEGCIPACKLALEVRGTEGLKDRDHKNRTPLHVATLCAHGDMINFLLERGADPTAVDADGLMPIDYVKSHQLYYCAMVFSVHLQYQELQTEPSNANPLLFLKSPQARRGSESKDKIRTIPAEERVAGPSAPPPLDLIDKQQVDPPLESPKILPSDNIDVTDYDGFEIEEEEEDFNGESHQVSRRHSVPAMLAPIKTLPRRKNSEPPPVKMAQIEKEEYESCEETAKEEKEPMEKPVPAPRKQSTLIRQGGLSHDSEEHSKPDSFDGPTFGIRTELGETLVLLGNFENEEQDSRENLMHSSCDLENEYGDNEMELSSAKLNQSHGSPTSVHSEPDNADACSVSVAVSVSSIGSDDEDAQQETAEDIVNQGKLYEENAKQFKIKEESERRFADGEKDPLQSQGDLVAGEQRVPKERKQAAVGSRMQGNHSFTTARRPPQMTYYEKPLNTKVPVNPAMDVQEDHPSTKKKKDKKKKNRKGETVNVGVPTQASMTRGLAGTLEPPQMVPLGSKLGNHLATKPAPWEHSPLGLKKGPHVSHVPQPPRNNSEHYQQRHGLGPPEYVRSSSGSIESFDQFDFDSDVAYARPITPEPPQQSSRGLMGHALQPVPPELGPGDNGNSGYSRPLDGSTFERDAVYGPPGPRHGPQAQARGQAMLRNTDFGRGPVMKLDPRAQALNRPRTPQGIALHSGVQSPHPPIHH